MIEDDLHSLWYSKLTPEQKHCWDRIIDAEAARLAEAKEKLIWEHLIKEYNYGKEQSTAETQTNEERLREEGSRLPRE
jgi:hypothetical protein